VTLIAAEFSIAVPATASQLYDVFAYNNAGVAALELLAWTTDTTRATAIVRTTTGTWTKSGDLTRRYLGSMRTTTVSGQTEDSATKRYLYNAANRVRRPLLRREPTVSWNYTLAAWRQANGSTANQVEVVIGIAEELLSLSLRANALNGTSLGLGVGFGEDSTSVISTSQVGGGSTTEATGLNSFRDMSAFLNIYPAVGRHFYAWLEYSQASGTTTWYGTPGSSAAPAATGNGLSGWITQ
jgi:hypothetical protein